MTQIQIRIFIYGAFGVSALIGGITSLTQLAASESKWYSEAKYQYSGINGHIIGSLFVSGDASPCLELHTCIGV